MSATLADSLALVLPRLRSALVSEAALERLRSMAMRLPPIHRAGFECRLDAHDTRVDLQQGIVPANREPQLLADYIAALDAQDNGLHPAWRHLRDFCERWSDSSAPLHTLVPELWLEFDIDGGNVANVAPCVFAILKSDVGDGRESLALAQQVLGLLLRHELPPALRDCLGTCADACSDGARITHVAAMLGRETRALRIHISHLPLRLWPRYLGRIGWPGDGSDVQEQGRWLLDIVDQVVLCLEVRAQIQPQLGLECFFTQKHGVDPRWVPLLDQLVGRGLCTAAKRDALLAWAGYIEPQRISEPWPEAQIVASLLEPAHRFGVFDRRLSHVKLTYLPDQPLRAKAYFGYGHVWVRPQSKLRVSAAAPASDTLEPSSARAAVRTRSEALTAAISFLVASRNQAGWWRDFYDLQRPDAEHTRVTGYASDEWVTAYIGAVLANARTPAAQEAAHDAWHLLLSRRPIGGWGYHGQLPPDADSTVWVLRLVQALGVEDTERLRDAHRFLRAQLRPGGGVACYRAQDAPLLARFLNTDEPFDGWCAVHTCVTAAAAALDLGDEPLRYLCRVQERDGRWTGHWWDEDAYTTAQAVGALRRGTSVDHHEAVRRAARWAASRVQPTGAVRCPFVGGDSVFATALCVIIMSPLAAEEPLRGAIRRAVRWLTTQQRGDGSFPPSARLRVPAPAALQSLATAADTLVYLDRNALFTTATVVAALDVAPCYSEAEEAE
ncbi:MAG TPA: prenyltransferase/squalene oxidase repeat-containing protein [Gemmatimonadaceae bacterium]|nr:prenyltransferase/squalene oxidase repeat-containing protein [Gemmatimonadaceae bacterium]